MSNIVISGVNEGNLKDISLSIPRNKLIVITGVSGSGKTTLAVDVIFHECQRQYLESMGLQGINKPKVSMMKNLSPAVMISHAAINKNPRSTVGILTNIYNDLRGIYEKLGMRICPHCKKEIINSQCKEKMEVKDKECIVYIYCNHCNHKMIKLTENHMSFNTKEGACEVCQGLGKILTVNKDTVLEELSLEDGAVKYWEQGYKDYQIESLYNAFRHYGIPVKLGTPVKDYTKEQKSILYHGVENEKIKKAFPKIMPPKNIASGRFEGVFETLMRKVSDGGGENKYLNEYFDYNICPECKGERLCKEGRSIMVLKMRMPQLTVLAIDELYQWVNELEESLPAEDMKLIESHLVTLKTKMKRIISVGLGYLPLDRQSVTLSGGEMQRIRLASVLDSDLTGVIYIMDEPTIGLHPKDTLGMMTVLKNLRDLGNTVIIIEHDVDVMNEADYIIDMGPGSGKEGGKIIGQGTMSDILNMESSVTGIYLKNEKYTFKEKFRKGEDGVIKITNSDLHNLKNVTVNIPKGCLISVTGVSGSGKSTLVFDVLGRAKEKKLIKTGMVSGLETFGRVVRIEQYAMTKMKRSNVATYMEIYKDIREIFSELKEAKEKGLSSCHFSFNIPGGRCENCGGLGHVECNMLFFANTDVVCPVCEGKQFNSEVLSVKYKGHNIKEILCMSVDEALAEFVGCLTIEKVLKVLTDVGLGYIELGRSVTSLSGGECQRLKLAKELIDNTTKSSLYLLDEPTTGLHPMDVDDFLNLLNKIVDSGNTVIVVEHNQQIIRASDWVIDLGPYGGNKGGNVVFEGTPDKLIKCDTPTARALLKNIK